MQELFNSMVRLSAAITVFGIQQVQSAVGSSDTKESVDRLREVIDAMAVAVSSRIDQTRQPGLNNISNLGYAADSTWDSLKVPAMKNTTDMVNTTSGWLEAIVKAGAPASSDPKAAWDSLSGR